MKLAEYRALCHIDPRVAGYFAADVQRAASGPLSPDREITQEMLDRMPPEALEKAHMAAMRNKVRPFWGVVIMMAIAAAWVIVFLATVIT